jgi:hypothetical protein
MMLYADRKLFELLVQRQKPKLHLFPIGQVIY